MKFTAGYLLGGLTVIGLGVSFCAGIVTCDWVYAKKNETAAKVSDATVGSMMAEYFKNRRN